ncbi:MAG: zinc-dependent metalloprotease family protein [Bacteroidota bacterium]
MGKNLLFVFTLLLCNTVFAQEKNMWKQINESSIKEDLFAGKYKPKAYKIFQLSEIAFGDDLGNAPLEKNVRVNNSNFVLSIPDADGKINRFKLVEAPVMDPLLAEKFPNIKSYAGQGIDDPTSTIRCDFSPRGFHAMILSNDKKTVYIDPVDRVNKYYTVFERPDVIDYTKTFHCMTPATVNEAVANIAPARLRRGADDGKLRTYRLALACTGEYAQYFLNGSETTDAQRKAKVLAAMVTLVTRTNAIYERDFGIRMNLVANNDAIIYLSASTDPWATEWNTKTQTTIDAVIGNANYDIGHLVHKEALAANNNGNAGCIGCVCKTGSKGSAFTSHVNPEGDPFIVDYTTHEMGHQFGGNHTFTFSNESGTAAQYEPGSGSTIMGYAGITGTTDVQAHSDDYFHARSVEQITDYIKGSTGGGCAVITLTGNATPVVNAGADYTIPKSTPFALTGSATDATSGDVLSYTWEQYNTGTRTTTMPSATATTGPVFRSRPYSTSPTRVFPILSSILNGTNTNTWEKLPSVARTLAFRLTVRDNHAGGGANNTDDMSVAISSTTGPFLVTAPNTAVTFAGGTSQAITWSVNGTTGTPINCANVKISLSTDGGQTFPTVLAASTANDGTETLTIPATPTTTARIKVEAVGNIFFDISNTNFTITGPTCGNPTALTSSAIGDNTATVSWTGVSNAISYAVDYKLASTSTWTSATTSTTSTSIILAGLAQGSVYDWRVKATCASGSGSNVQAQFTTTAPFVCNAPSGLTASAITTTGATVSWTAVSGAVSYAVDYKLSSSSTWISADAATTSTSITLTGLDASSVYDWRVATNCSGETSGASTAQFTTAAPFVCNAPTGLASSAITSSSATVSWTAVSGALSYTLEYKLNTASTWTTAAAATTLTSFGLSSLTASSLYDWRVTTNCTGETSGTSDAQFTTTTVSTCATAYEANETLATAATIATGAPISAAIGSSTDVDYYKIVTTATGNITVALSNLPGDYDLYVYNSAGTQLGLSENASTNNESVALTGQAAGTYYIKVIGYSGAFSTTVCYSLNATTSVSTGCVSIYDNSTNGTTAGAAQIPLNTNITGLINVRAEEDYYKFVITTGGTITIGLSTLPGDYDVKLYSSNGTTQLGVSQNNGTANETISYTAAAGTYYLRVYPFKNASSATSCYTLKVTTGTASKGANNFVSADRGSKQLVDVFPNPAKNIVNINLTGFEGVSQIRLFDINGREVMTKRTALINSQLDITTLPKGVYLVKVLNGNKIVSNTKIIKQ